MARTYPVACGGVRQRNFDSEISVGAIEICGILTQLEKDLPHLEAGCRYMEKGRYSQAEAEFNKVSYYY